MKGPGPWDPDSLMSTRKNLCQDHRIPAKDQTAQL